MVQRIPCSKQLLLTEPVYLAGCKALGLINELLTGPLWHVLESTVSILDMNEVYTSMRDQFKVWSEDASSFFEGMTALFDDTTIKHWEILDDHLMENPNNAIVQEILQVIFKSFLYPLWMSSGRSPSWGSSWQTKWGEKMPDTVSTKNKHCERDFAQLDRFLRVKPNATTVALESLILFSNKRMVLAKKWWAESKNICFSQEDGAKSREAIPSKEKSYPTA